MPIATLSRRETFSASHRLWSKGLSDADNRALFGKCANDNGHGHNYTLEVLVRGPIEPATGLVMDLSELKIIIDKNVIDKVDHRHLNLDVPEFRDLNPTTENLAYVVWQWLSPALGKMLYEVRVQETENNFAIYRGE